MNCTYSVFAASPDDFRAIFPEPGQDIEFIDDFVERVGKRRGNWILKRLWAAPVNKKVAHGIHGTLFYELQFKRQFYPKKR